MSATLSEAGRTLFQLAFGASPIILNNGIATNISGGYLPLIVLTEGLSLINGLISGSVPDSLDDLFAQFIPLPGATLVNNQIGMYPFANKQVAANAIVVQTLNISLAMIAPVRDAGGFVSKIATFTALQAALRTHNTSGGTYTICTPSFIYTNCLLTALTDITSSDNKQAQMQWQWDFVQPLVTLQSAASAQNGLMSQLTNGFQITGLPSFSGIASSIGNFVSGTANSILGTNVGGFVSAAPIPVTAEPLA